MCARFETRSLRPERGCRGSTCSWHHTDHTTIGWQNLTRDLADKKLADCGQILKLRSGIGQHLSEFGLNLKQPRFLASKISPVIWLTGHLQKGQNRGWGLVSNPAGSLHRHAELNTGGDCTLPCLLVIFWSSVGETLLESRVSVTGQSMFCARRLLLSRVNTYIKDRNLIARSSGQFQNRWFSVSQNPSAKFSLCMWRASALRTISHNLLLAIKCGTNPKQAAKKCRSENLLDSVMTNFTFRTVTSWPM